MSCPVVPVYNLRKPMQLSPLLGNAAVALLHSRAAVCAILY